MQETTTTCDRCGKVETEATASWSNLWVQASTSTTLDLCEQCGKALLGWVQTGPSATVSVAELSDQQLAELESIGDEAETEAEVAGPTPRDRTPGFA